VHRSRIFFVSLALPKILSFGKLQTRLHLPSLIRTLTASKILLLGNAQINLALPSLIRIFGFTQDTPSRHNQTFGLLLRSTFRIFDSVLDTSASAMLK